MDIEKEIDETFQEEKKINYKLIKIFLTVLVLIALISVICVAIFKIINKQDKDGKYTCDDWKSYGVTMEMIIDKENVTIEMIYDTDGNMLKNTQKGTIAFDGDKVSLSLEQSKEEVGKIFMDEKVTGKYDKDKKTITLEVEENSSFEFIKAE